jgi:hypothetical protein
MCKYLPAALVGLVFLVGPTLAQDYPPEQVAMVKNFYRKYLHRDPEPAGLLTWLGHLQNGASPSWVIATMLSSNEYYNNAGGDDEGYAVSLFKDLAGRRPTRGELRYWMERLQNQTHQDVVEALMMRFRPRR